jgi:serine/threonine protein kinase
VKGLNYLHRSGYVHRDIKPQNIVLSEDVTLDDKAHFIGKIKIIDLEFLQSTKIVTNKIAGTPGYIPINIVQNQFNYDLKHADFYAAGIILFQSCQYINFPHYRIKNSKVKIINSDDYDLKPETNIFVAVFIHWCLSMPHVNYASAKKIPDFITNAIKIIAKDKFMNMYSFEDRKFNVKVPIDFAKRKYVENPINNIVSGNKSRILLLGLFRGCFGKKKIEKPEKTNMEKSNNVLQTSLKSLRPLGSRISTNGIQFNDLPSPYKSFFKKLY